MATSWTDSLPRLFARRAAEELAKVYGVNGARSRVMERLAEADPDDELLFQDILDALEELGRRPLS